MKKCAILLMCALLSSCMTDYATIVNVEYKNESSHTIYFTQPSQGVQFTIPQNELITLSFYQEVSKKGFDPDSFEPYIAWNENLISHIRYDHTVEIALSATNYCWDGASYEYLGNDKFRLVLTDADYQFALENGTVVE